MTEKSTLLFEYSPWWILVCLLAGLVYAFLLYQKNSTWPATTNKLLFTLRFVLVSLAALLLLSPFLRMVLNEVEPPTFIIAIDNSTSVPNGLDSVQLRNVEAALDELASQLADKDIKIEKRNLANEPLERFSSAVYDQKVTDLSGLLRSWQTEFEGRSFAGALLVSDGIYNRGIAPQYLNFANRIYTLGIGDTIPVNDVILNSVQYNKIAYQGNLFPLRAEIISQGIESGTLKVSVKKDGVEVASNTISLSEPDQLLISDFRIPAEEQGLQHYVVEVDRHPSEEVTVNNRQDVYVDIVEGKEKILIASGAPHPDIKAIKAALSKNENYEVTTYIPTVDRSMPMDVFDLVILHSPFDRQRRLAPLLDRVKREGFSAWYILGNATQWEEFNSQDILVTADRSRNESDQVRPAFNDAFSLFTFENDWKGVINSYYTPVTVPYGEYTVKGGASVALFQKIGAITTNRPMWVISQNQLPKQAVTIGEGIWQWRMQEFSRTEAYASFDNLVLKTVQYLSSKEDKRKFRVYTSKTEFFDNEQIVFHTEAYNDVFEPIYGQEVDLKVTKTTGDVTDYSYTTAPGNTRFRINNLSEGIYRFEATAMVNGRRESAGGQFTVLKLDLENLKQTADFNTLRELAGRTGGSFFTAGQLELLEQNLLSIDPKGKIYSSEDYLPVIHLWWIFFVLLVLLSTEWFIRKYSGSY